MCIDKTPSSRLRHATASLVYAHTCTRGKLVEHSPSCAIKSRKKRAPEAARETRLRFACRAVLAMFPVNLIGCNLVSIRCIRIRSNLYTISIPSDNSIFYGYMYVTFLDTTFSDFDLWRRKIRNKN